MDHDLYFDYPASDHETELLRNFGEDFFALPERRRAPPRRTLILCFTNRCGSTYLGGLLRSTILA